MHTEYKTLLITHAAPVLTVQLNIPEAGNAISGQVLDDLLDVMGKAEADPETRVLVLSGAGEDFSLGGDRTEYSSLLTEDPSGQALGEHLNRAKRVCDALRETELVTIAKLHGKVIGAGLGISVLCDLRIGADNCSFVMPELLLGVPPAWGGILPRLLLEGGFANMRELLLTSERFDATTAKQLAILTKVVPPDELDSAVDERVRALARRKPAALRITKQMLNDYASRVGGASTLDGPLLMAAMSSQRLSRLS
ncbi:enoyl-CoA hydratase/isomerase family protein [Streptomyces sp. 2MCAF27]